MTISIENWRVDARHFAFEDTRIAYWTKGDRRPLLLIHGFPTSSWDWAPIWKALAQSHRLIAADLIGFGLSDKPRADYSIGRQCDMLLALLDHLEIDEFDILAHDYGASVAQELLARQKDGAGAAGLSKIVFLNGGMFARYQRTRPIMRLARSPLGFLVSKTLNRKSFGKHFSSIFGTDSKPGEDRLDIFWSLFTEQDGNRIIHRLAHYIQDRHISEERWDGALKDAQDRIGLINGAADPIAGEHCHRRWVKQLPHAKEHLLPGVGHYPHVEAPAEVASMALNWLRQSG
ncbi:alpha/beta fold hydrolase [Pontixanthobacter aquaemixtae]|uniref:Alpha/beta fold hydrolase n=1 Tax=Pontixanthobacter aquaemixtae TaxID=1958940 RepID=A0A844ZUP3_9SPHN|nr:alpha/beta hydrolase [Pontixanthobacter aquaemixtae]MXO90507.1 alpha/beta fold hydrolase [Pontixanthobacter aquaemixtae]